MYKGTGASSGIGLGTAVVVEEAELVIRKEVVGNPEAELERFKGVSFPVLPVIRLPRFW